MTIVGNPNFVVSINPTFIKAPQDDSAPDSITIGGGSIWVEYGNGASSTGVGTITSTIVQYNLTTGSQVGQPILAAGLADGLKYDPATGNVWVLNNNDGNSNLQVINPTTQQISDPLTYGSGYVYGVFPTSRGFDDVVFDGNRVFLSETNPANPGDPVIVQLKNGGGQGFPFQTNRKLQTTGILSSGDTGTNLVTGEKNQPLPVMDPDSLKLLPNGDLLLTGEADGAFIFVQNPGTKQQTESFVTLPTNDVPDDAIMPTSSSGTFYISDQGSNNIVSVQVTGLNTNDLYAVITAATSSTASPPSPAPDANELVQIDLTTGAVTTVVSGLDNPHGLAFVPSSPGALAAADPPTSNLSVNHAPTTTTGVQNLGLDHAVALLNQFTAGFPAQQGGQITTNALSQITTNEQHFLTIPHHG